MVNFDVVLMLLSGMAVRHVVHILVEPADTIVSFGIGTESV